MSIKTGSSGLVICVSKSLRWFLDLDLKTKRASIYRLRHKIDGARSERDTHRDLTACFVRKQVGLGFPQTSRLAESRQWVVHVAPSQMLHRVQVEDGRVNATDCVEPWYPCLPVSFY
jgi:hypothetical protein